MSQGLRVLLAAFVLYRLARLLAVDDGPLWIFARLREWADSQDLSEQGYYAAQCKQGDDARFEALLKKNRGRRFWASFNDGIRCPYCVGVWLALPVFFLYRFPGWFSDALLVLGGITGGQVFLKSQERDQ